MTDKQWHEVQEIVRKEKVQALQHMNNRRYDELSTILDELYALAPRYGK